MKDKIHDLIIELEDLAQTDFSGLQSWWYLRAWQVGESRNLDGMISTKKEQDKDFILFEATFPPGHIFMPHWHNCYEDVTVIEGVMEDYENEEVIVRKGETYTFRPWESHSPCNSSPDKLHVYIRFYKPSLKN